jgi:glycosyltransferase involved in cell wall biosynthesis
MRILFVVSSLGLGGAERQVVLLSRELVRLGHAVSIYALSRYDDRIDELAASQVEVMFDQKRLRLDPGVIWRLRRHISAWHPDIVHGFLFDGNLYARLACIGTGSPVLDSERSDNYTLSTLQSIGYRLTSALSSGVVANTYAGAEFARRIHGSTASNAHVVWNGIDLGAVDLRLVRSAMPARDLMPGDRTKRACIVGTIKPAKDFILAMRVARRLVETDPSWRFICVGDSAIDATVDYKARVLAEKDRLGLKPYVKFIGSRRDVPELMASCDVLLVTSVHEGFPNVVLEAMACGTPVVSTDYSDVQRILPFPWQVVASRDESELAACVVRCLADRSEVAVAQRRWVESHATVAISASALLDVYGKYAKVPVESLGQAS